MSKHSKDLQEIHEFRRKGVSFTDFWKFCETESNGFHPLREIGSIRIWKIQSLGYIFPWTVTDEIENPATYYNAYIRLGAWLLYTAEATTNANA